METAQGLDATYEYDFLIVGSGFGGSVSALRLAEKGERAAALTALVGVCEAAADEHARKARRLARGLQAAIAAAIVLAALLLLWPFLPRS